MWLPGWCCRCKRIKRVHVTMPPVNNRVPFGLCRECEDKE